MLGLGGHYTQGDVRRIRFWAIIALNYCRCILTVAISYKPLKSLVQAGTSDFLGLQTHNEHKI